MEGGILRSGTPGSYSYSVKAHFSDKPVNFVSWYDGARFANWLHNGQPTGMQDNNTTEDGAYTFSGLEKVSARTPDAKFYMPNEHEWEKAAFYEPGADTLIGDGWWRNPGRSDVFPGDESIAVVDEFGNVTNPGRNVVVFRKGSNWNGTVNGNVTTVGSSGNESYYGARDMTGNVFEWVTHDPTKPDPLEWGPYNVRGGSFIQFGHVDISERNLVHHHNHGVVHSTVGFRLAAAILERDPADFNLDSLVNAADLQLWQESFGVSSAGDADGDGDLDGNDFLIWQQHFSFIEPLASANVPEPSSGLLLWGLAAVTWMSSRMGSRNISVSFGEEHIGSLDTFVMKSISFFSSQSRICPSKTGDSRITYLLTSLLRRAGASISQFSTLLGSSRIGVCRPRKNVGG